LGSAPELKSQAPAAWRQSTALHLALATGQIEQAQTLAVALLKTRPTDPRALRLWALVELHDPSLDPPWTQDPIVAARAIESLWPRAEGLEGWAKREALREIAFVALHAGAWQTADDARLSALDTPSPELTLLRLRAQLHRGSHNEAEALEQALREDADSTKGSPLRLPIVEGPHGPDELSPLRSAEGRESALVAHAHLCAALVFESRGSLARAHQALVASLIECPDLRAPRELLLRSQALQGERRIEDLLSQATRRLGTLPRAVAGLEIDAVESSLEAVVTIRERLARPLTIAIMGEFSSGKSTFVNAWLGRQLAPMGALPTTCTINVFRHGGKGQARIHRRDGRIELVAKSDLLTFLDSLDEEAAQSIRHVEIERGELGGGHASIVDTPGLNALDPYHEKVAREFLAEADAVVWVFSATQGAAASERAMLEELRGDGRRVLGVLNKVDILEPGEDQELMSYLREKLGEVLVEVLPLSASSALDWREKLTTENVGQLESDDDPMQTIDRALEHHFLAKARELKVEICSRELGTALEAALRGLDECATQLEARAPAFERLELATLRTQLSDIVDAIAKAWASSAEGMNRELMALGVYEAQHGPADGRPDAHDHRYFVARLSREASSAMASCLFALRGSGLDDALLDTVSDRLLPWLNGYLGGLADAGALEQWLVSAAKSAFEGEDAARAQLATRFESMAPLAREELARIEATLLAKLRASERRRKGRGAAEALGLRALGETTLRPVIEALEPRDAN
jgi:GTPase Era involved in 16S rRNA processing